MEMQIMHILKQAEEGVSVADLCRENERDSTKPSLLALFWSVQHLVSLKPVIAIGRYSMNHRLVTTSDGLSQAFLFMLPLLAQLKCAAKNRVEWIDLSSE